MVATQRAGHIALDEERVLADLEIAAGFSYSRAYSEYLCGGPWESAMLWSTGGDEGDGLITNYDHGRAGAVTGYGRELPYLRSLVESNFNLEHLNFARLAVISDAVTLPHRDLLELDDIPAEARNSHRVHVPLVTNEDCLFTEDNVVYRMTPGDIWCFDSSRVHGAASLSARARTHLILDFSDAGGNDLGSFSVDSAAGIPPECVVERPRLSEAERAAVEGLSAVLNRDTVKDVLAILVKLHYRRDGGDDFVWSTADALAERTGDPAVVETMADMHRYFLLERSS